MRYLLVAVVLSVTLNHTRPVNAASFVSLTPITRYHEQGETDSAGAELNRETGYLHGASIAVEHVLNDRWNFQTSGQWLTGSLDYRGQTQAGAALTTQTRYHDRRLDMAATRCLSTCSTQLGGGLGYYQRQRNIQRTSRSLPLYETYTGWEFLLTARHYLVPQRLWLNAAVVRQFNSQVVPDLSEIGYGRPRVALPNSWAGKVGVSFQLPAWGQLHSNLGLEYEYRQTPRSRAARATGTSGAVLLVSQPETWTQQWQLGVTLFWPSAGSSTLP